MNTTKNSLIINFSLPIINTTSTFVRILINDILVHVENENVQGLYIAPIEVGDVITVDIRNLDPYNQRAGLDIYRKNYMTDDTNGDNGITTDYITGFTANPIVSAVTFSNIIVQPNNSSYHLEYLLNINANRYNPITPSGDVIILNGYKNINDPNITPKWYILYDYGAVFTEKYLNSLCDFPNISPVNNTSAVNSNADVIYIGASFPLPGGVEVVNRFNNFLIKSMDFGNTFQPVYSFPNSNDIIDIKTSNTGQFVAVYCMIVEPFTFPLYYRLYFSSNYGIDWNLYNIGTGYSFNSMTIDKTNGFPIYFTNSGQSSFVYKLNTSGGTLTQISNIPAGAWSNYLVSDDNKYHFVSANGYGTTSGKFLLSTNSGTTFNQVFSSMIFYDEPLVDMNSTGQYILISNKTENKLYLSSNYGSTINTIRSGFSCDGLTISSTGQYIYTQSKVNINQWLIDASANYGSTFVTLPIDPDTRFVTNTINTN